MLNSFKNRDDFSMIMYEHLISISVVYRCIQATCETKLKISL